MAFGDKIREAVNDSAGGTNVTATFGASPTTGNLIVATAYAGDDTDLVPQGDLLEAIENPDTTNTDTTVMGYRVVVGGDGTTWGFTQGSADQFAIILREFEGPWAASPLDQTDTTAYASGSNPTEQMTAGPTATTSQNDELAVAAWGFRDPGSNVTLTLDSVSDSFTDELQEDNSPASFQKSIGTAYKVLTGTGTPQTTATFSLNGAIRFGALIATFKKAADPLDLEQEGYRWRDDDGSEAAATWLASQDNNISRDDDTNTRLRVLINATNDPASSQYQLEYRKDGNSEWHKITTQ